MESQYLSLYHGISSHPLILNDANAVAFIYVGEHTEKYIFFIIRHGVFILTWNIYKKNGTRFDFHSDICYTLFLTW